jgi:hypothetical protein
MTHRGSGPLVMNGLLSASASGDVPSTTTLKSCVSGALAVTCHVGQGR